MANETSTIPENNTVNAPVTTDAPQAIIEQPVAPVQMAEDTSVGSKGLIFGFGALLVIAVIAFFIKNAYANHLVSKQAEPRRANMAGWCLFGTVLPLAAIAVFAFIDPSKFLALIYLLPLGAIALISLVLMIVSSKSK
jgi:hypothetical protein